MPRRIGIASSIGNHDEKPQNNSPTGTFVSAALVLTVSLDASAANAEHNFIA